MNMELFSSMQEGVNFLNYKANQRIIELEDFCKINKEEIYNNVAKCKTIFTRYNEENLIENVLLIDEQLKNEDLIPEEIEKLNTKKDELLASLKKFLDELLVRYNNETINLEDKMKYLSDKEDIEFAYKKILNRSLELQNKQDIIEKIETNYSEARNFDVTKYKSESSTFHMISEFLKATNKDTIEINNINDELNLNNLFVVKIEEAPSELLIEDEETINKIDDNTLTIESDTSFFGVDDNLTESILNNERINLEETNTVENNETNKSESITLDELIQNEEKALDVEIEEEIVPNFEDVEIESIVDLSSTIESQEKNVELSSITDNKEDKSLLEEENNQEEEAISLENIFNTNEYILEEPEKEQEKGNASLTYTLDKNDNLYNLAFALFQDEKLVNPAIEIIIQENKENIENKLKEENLSMSEDIYKKSGVLSGVNLDLSNVFEKVIEKQNQK